MEKKKRGRPPKKTKKIAEIDSVKVRVSETLIKKTSKMKRAVGRPPKNPQAADIEPNGEEESVRVSDTKKREKLAVVRPPRTSEPSLMKGEDETEANRVLELGQIWAYPTESGGGSPFSYARIDRIFPTQSLLQITPLQPHPISEEEISFAEQGLTLACGVFKPANSTCIEKISNFTHNVTFEFEGKGKSLYRIFPKKGEVWAIYLKWDGTRKNFEHKLVEVVSDFSERNGVNVFGLSRAERRGGGVYRREVYDGFYLIRNFSRRFMPMFSHHVPACKINEGGEILWKEMMLQ